MKERSKYTKEFKIAAVGRWEEVRNFNEVGRELGISSSLIRKWRKAAARRRRTRVPGERTLKG